MKAPSNEKKKRKKFWKELTQIHLFYILIEELSRHLLGTSKFLHYKTVKGRSTFFKHYVPTQYNRTIIDNNFITKHLGGGVDEGDDDDDVVDDDDDNDDEEDDNYNHNNNSNNNIGTNEFVQRTMWTSLQYNLAKYSRT